MKFLEKIKEHLTPQSKVRDLNIADQLKVPDNLNPFQGEKNIEEQSQNCKLRYRTYIGVNLPMAHTMSPFVRDGMTLLLPATMYTIIPTEPSKVYHAIEMDDHANLKDYPSLFKHSQLLYTMSPYGWYPMVYFDNDDLKQNTVQVFETIKNFEEIDLPKQKKHYSKNEKATAALNECVFMHMVFKVEIPIYFSVDRDKLLFDTIVGSDADQLNFKNAISLRDEKRPPKLVLNESFLEVLPKSVQDRFECKENEEFKAHLLQDVSIDDLKIMFKEVMTAT